MTQKAILIDIDNTIANPSHRKRLAKKNPKEFHKLSIKDDVNTWCQNLVYLYFTAGYKIIFFTERSEATRSATHLWLDEKAQLYHTGYELFMRQTDDKRSEKAVKQELYAKNILGKYDVEFVVDDNDKVCKMYEKHGITTLTGK